MKKICFVTAARSEYGLLKWLMHDISASERFQLQLVVTGGHLLAEQGRTLDAILKDGFKIDETIDVRLDVTSQATIAASMGRMGEGFAAAFERLRPDYLLVLGDRYELLPICSTAFVMMIPIIHLSGGDVTEGAIDDGIRNAVTMLASYHFPATEDSARNVIRMRGSDKNVWAVGDPGLDAFNRETPLTREALAQDLGLDPSARWALMTYHAETRQSLDHNLAAAENCIRALKALEGWQVVMTYANADFGGRALNDLLVRAAEEEPGRFRAVPSLGHLRYLSFMRQAGLVAGNSSSGISEAPLARVPVVNIGDRQKGRYQCGNVVQCDPSFDAIAGAMDAALRKKIADDDLGYWGDGHTSERIVKILSERL